MKDELWDMAKPKVPYAITLEDVLACGVGEVIVSMLIDAKAFYDYDQRESGEPTDDFEDHPAPAPSSSFPDLARDTADVHNTSI